VILAIGRISIGGDSRYDGRKKPENSGTGRHHGQTRILDGWIGFAGRRLRIKRGTQQRTAQS
jgi:hypothetical protein